MNGYVNDVGHECSRLKSLCATGESVCSHWIHVLRRAQHALQRRREKIGDELEQMTWYLKPFQHLFIF